MLIKKISIRNVTIYIVTAIMFLAFSIGKASLASASSKKVALSYPEQQSLHKNHKLVNGTSDSLELFHELFCEERSDEETKEDQTNYPSVLLIAVTKLIIETSSKEVVYYSDACNYTAPVGLYTLFCSWKSNLV